MDQNTINQLKAEVEIPEIVLQSADAAFAKIHQEAGDISFSRGSKNYQKGARRFAACAAVGLLTFSAITAGAVAYLHWSKGLEQQFQVPEEQKSQIEESGLTDFPNLSVEDEGVTVTLEQSIVDDYFAYLSFKVEGYEVPEGEQPEFQQTIAHVGDEEEDKVDMAGGYFYNGLVRGADGKYQMPDGSPIPEDENGDYVFCYSQEDGSLEYHYIMSATHDKGYFLDNPVHIEFSGLGTYSSDKSGEVVADVEGNWAFDWTLTGSDEIYRAECNEALGDTGATVLSAEISPVSIRVEFDFPYKETTEPAIDEATGMEYEAVTYEEVPELSGVRLKDGTMYPYLMEGGSMGYMDDDSSRVQVIMNTNRILDVDQVESLLFWKSYPGTTDSVTEDNLYEVKLQ